MGLLIQAICRFGCTVDEDFRIWQKGEPNISLLETPYQHLAELLTEVACRARAIAAEGTKEPTLSWKKLMAKRQTKAGRTSIPKRKASCKACRWVAGTLKCKEVTDVEGDGVAEGRGGGGRWMDQMTMGQRLPTRLPRLPLQSQVAVVTHRWRRYAGS